MSLGELVIKITLVCGSHGQMRKNNRRIKIKIENYRSSKGYEGEINEWMLVA